VVATTTAAIATTTTSRAAKEAAAATTTAVVKAEGEATGEDTAEATPTVVVTRREAEVDGTSVEAGAGDEEGNGERSATNNFHPAAYNMKPIHNTSSSKY